MFSSILLLGLSLFCGAFASDVIVLTESNFDSEAGKADVMLIEFYAPWCGHCKKLAPEYEIAATKLKKNDPPVPIAKVDCTVESSVCSKYGVSGYPTLKIFKNGEFSKAYEGQRSADAIVKTMAKEAGPVSKLLESVEAAKSFMEKDTVGVIGFLDSLDSAKAKTFMKVADQLADLRFAHTTSEDVKKELKQKEGIVLFRPKVLQSKFEEATVVCSETSVPKIKKFLAAQAMGLCGVRSQGNAAEFSKPLFVVYYGVDYVKNPKGTNYWRNRVMKVGKKIKDEGEEVYFAISDNGEMGRELEECGITDAKADKPVVCGWDEAGKKYPMSGKFDMESFDKFVREVLAGKAEPYMKSEPIPTEDDGHVKVVVAKNFDEIVNNPDKDVLIEFYAPWCGHCKSLAPKYKELAEKLKDEEGITIAKMDATANDVPGNYEVRGFPTIFFAPKGNKKSPLKYEGGREVDDFVRYLSKESTDGLTTVDSSKKKKKAKKSEL